MSVNIRTWFKDFLLVDDDAKMSDDTFSSENKVVTIKKICDSGMYISILINVLFITTICILYNPSDFLGENTYENSVFKLIFLNYKIKTNYYHKLINFS